MNFTVPDAPPGHHTLLAIQKNAPGYDVCGSPARATIEVTANGLIIMTLSLGALGIGLFAAGGVAAVRQVRRGGVPARVGGRRH